MKRTEYIQKQDDIVNIFMQCQSVHWGYHSRMTGLLLGSPRFNSWQE